MTDTIKTDTGKTVYPLADYLTYEDKQALRVQGTMSTAKYQDLLRGDFVNVGAVLTGEKRPPKAGEWFISGAIPEAYRMPNDSTQAHHIARLIKYRTETRCIEVKDL